MPMLYRSPITRWFLALTGITGGVLFTFGDSHRWRSTPSLHWLAHAPIPLQWWGIAAIVYGLLLLVPKTRPAGFALGAVIFAVITVSLLATIDDGAPKNVWAIVGLLDVVVFHIYSIRTAWALRLAT